MSGPRVMFYVQHLLGIGHQRRGATLTRALVAAGLDVTYVSGGRPIPDLDLGGAELVQLPSLRAADAEFKVLVDENDQPIDEAWKARRTASLLAAYQACAPQVLVIELYPFGRRQMRFELLPLLDQAVAAQPRPVIVSSIRDILNQSSKPGRREETVERVNTYFDHVIVHGDPNLIPLDATFPLADAIAEKITYTGYVVDDRGVRRGRGGEGHGEVVVSAGGGAVGEQLLRCAMTARGLSRLNDRVWRVLVGVSVAEANFRAMRDSAPDGVSVERARRDFPDLLMNCALSISQGGYNTVMEVLRAGCPAVVVPFAGGQETEQTMRANLLAERGLLTVLSESALLPEQMAAAVDSALAPAAAGGLDMDGAAQGAGLIKEWIQGA